MNKRQKKHLVIAPHHDDEVIGCGGTIAQAISKGDIVRVVVVTKGDLSGSDKAINQMVKDRENECLQACESLGIEKENVIFLRKNDRSLVYSLEFVKEIINEISVFEANYIYFPHHEESDRDHRVVNEVVKEAVFLCQSGFLPNDNASFIKMCLQYEVWTPMKNYQVIKDITNFVDVKVKSIKRYESQLETLNLVEGVLGLNSYRGMQTGVKSAEVFKLESL
ncbi:PIG-L deacetylase family protein [Metabacillus idriensis]|uniref:PIG-L deacetylase family protein n=1 Tax=Metabacillus idriensis TaxID=324768 RepID=UPI00174E72BF|nr:PIG-L deacetylase family protein [Metabacillus idriensis]